MLTEVICFGFTLPPPTHTHLLLQILIEYKISIFLGEKTAVQECEAP